MHPCEPSLPIASAWLESGPWRGACRHGKAYHHPRPPRLHLDPQFDCSAVEQRLTSADSAVDSVAALGPAQSDAMGPGWLRRLGAVASRNGIRLGKRWPHVLG